MSTRSFGPRQEATTSKHRPNFPKNGTQWLPMGNLRTAQPMTNTQKKRFGAWVQALKCSAGVSDELILPSCKSAITCPKGPATPAVSGRDSRLLSVQLTVLYWWDSEFVRMFFGDSHILGGTQPKWLVYADFQWLEGNCTETVWGVALKGTPL